MKNTLPMLLAGVALLAGCQSKPATSVNTTPTAPAVLSSTTVSVDSSSSMSVSKGVELNRPTPLTSYQPAKLQDVAASPTSFSALVLCPPDTAGALSVQIQLKPQQHSIEKLTLVYAGTSQRRKINQIGQGVGHYDPKTQQYFFNVHYQTISELPNNTRRNSELYEINGWVSTEKNTAGVQPISLAR